MGSDVLFRKGKARKAAELQRQQGARDRNERFLIVCEGTKTEPLYFRDLRDDLRIRSQLVTIPPNDGVSPDRVVSYALALYEEESRSGDAFDAVYCVFDRDKHTTFNEAVQRTKDLSAEGKRFVAITSDPCFEVWLLLHFDYSTQPFHAVGKKSVGDQVVSVLKTKPGFAKYGKGQIGIYAQLKDKLTKAINHAAQLRKHSVETDSTNPTTDVDLLVNVIKGLVAK